MLHTSTVVQDAQLTEHTSHVSSANKPYPGEQAMQEVVDEQTSQFAGHNMQVFATGSGV